MPTIGDLRRFLEGIVSLQYQTRGIGGGLTYLCMEDFVLQHGQDCEWQKLPFRRRFPWNIPRFCFGNAFELARHKNLLYVEGYAWGNACIPVHHAWCIDPENPHVALDPTWKRGHAYIGVAFDLDLVEEVRFRSSTMLDDWRADWPLLTGKLKNWEPKDSNVKETARVRKDKSRR